MYDEESYEELILNHMIKCSVSAAAMDARKVAATADTKPAPHAKPQAINDHRKPAAAARKIAPIRRLPICRRTIPVTSCNGNKLPVAKKTPFLCEEEKPAAKEAAPPETIDTSVSSRNGCVGDVSPLKDGKQPAAARWRLDVVPQESNGGATNSPALLLPGTTDTSTVFKLTKDTSRNNPGYDEQKRLGKDGLKKAPPSDDDDTAATCSTTKESTNSTEVITVDSNHFLAQKWWREKTVTKKSRVSLSFNIEHCVQVSNPNDNNSAAAVTVTEGPTSSKAKLRRRNDILEITCPVCKKTLNKRKSVSFEDCRLAILIVDVVITHISFWLLYISLIIHRVQLSRKIK